MNSKGLWVFGYGSLCWHPGFEADKMYVGCVKNYLRRFWQGNTTHRGLPGKPGRVATLIKGEGFTWGVAYELTGDAALSYLNKREVTLGGYHTEFTTFVPRDQNLDPFTVLVYVATPTSKDWAGPAPLQDIATQITWSYGPVGHNVEYLLRLSEFMREKIPEAFDPHLYTLEKLVLKMIEKHNLCLDSLMDSSRDHVTNGIKVKSDMDVDEALGQGFERNGDGVPKEDRDQAEEGRRSSFSFASHLSTNKLRCLNI